MPNTKKSMKKNVNKKSMKKNLKKRTNKSKKRNYIKRGGTHLRSLLSLVKEKVYPEIDKLSEQEIQNLIRKLYEVYGGRAEPIVFRLQKERNTQKAATEYLNNKRKKTDIDKILIPYDTDEWYEIVDSERFRTKLTDKHLKYKSKIEIFNDRLDELKKKYAAFAGNSNDSNNSQNSILNVRTFNNVNNNIELLKSWENFKQNRTLNKLDKFTDIELKKIMNYYNQENKSELIEFMTEMNTQLENKRLNEDLLMKSYLKLSKISLIFQPLRVKLEPGATTENYTIISKTPVSFINNINKMSKNTSIKPSNILKNQGLLPPEPNKTRSKYLNHANLQGIGDETNGFIAYEFFKDTNIKELKNLELFVPSYKLHRKIMKKYEQLNNYSSLESVN